MKLYMQKTDEKSSDLPSDENLLAFLKPYPQKRQYALAVFQDIQARWGYIPRSSLPLASVYLKVPLAELYAMITFYRSFSLAPRGRHVIKVCDGTACHIRGSLRAVDALERLRGLKPGQTTEDGLFSLEVVNCLGACALAPAMIIDEEYFGKLTEEKIDGILKNISLQGRAGFEDERG